MRRQELPFIVLLEFRTSLLGLPGDTTFNNMQIRDLYLNVVDVD